MTIAIVRFPLPPGVTREGAQDLYRASAPHYQAAPGLLRKFYLFDEAAGGGGVYVWKDRLSAEQFYSPEWKASLKARLGSKPRVEIFDSPVEIDNLTGQVVVA